MGEPPRRRLQPLPHKLEQLQRCGRAPPLFTAVPHSGLTPIEAMLDEASDLKSEKFVEFRRRFQRSSAFGSPACPPSCYPQHPQPTVATPLPSAGVVLLGFTRDGCHLVSYTTQPAAAADGQDGYSLQLWSFAPGARCRRLWSVPLFRCGGVSAPALCIAACLCIARPSFDRRPVAICCPLNPQDATIPRCAG